MSDKRKRIIKAIAARPLSSRFDKWSDIFPPMFNESRESFAERAFLWGSLVATHQFAGPWEPIATAPRDGRTILVRFGEDRVCEASYIVTRPAYPWQFIDVKDLGWIVNYATDGAGGPSHWRSMPPASTDKHRTGSPHVLPEGLGIQWHRQDDQDGVRQPGHAHRNQRVEPARSFAGDGSSSLKAFKLRLARIAPNLFRSNFIRAFLSGYQWYRKWHGGRWEYWWLDSCSSFVWFDVNVNACWPAHRPLSSSGMPSVENWPIKDAK